MEQIRLGTVGSGTIVHSILDNVRITDGIRLAAKYGAGKVYTDMDAFLADGDVNFVYIALPNLLHYEQAKRTSPKADKGPAEGLAGFNSPQLNHSFWDYWFFPANSQSKPENNPRLQST